jgi:hypothetical protein
MSEYIKKIEKDYNDGKISIDEISKLRQNYNKLSAYEKGNLEIKFKKKKSDSKTNKSSSKIIYQEKVINLLIDQNSKLSTIKGILMFFLVLTILSLIASIIIVTS